VNIRLLAWFNFCLDFRLYAPVAILYFSDVAGSFTLGMSVFSAIMLSGALLEVPTGVFSDRIGRKRTLVLGSGASVASVTLYAVGGSYWPLLGGAILEGLGRALFSGNNDALLHDTLTESGQQDAYQDYLGKTSAMFQVALAISAILGSIIAFISFPLVMWLSVIPQVAGLVISLRIVEPAHHYTSEGNVYAHTWTALRHILRNRRLRTISAASVLGYAFGESAWQFRAAFIETLWPVWAIGVAQTLSNIGAAFSFYLSGRLIRRFGEFKLLVVGDAYSAAANITALLLRAGISPALMATPSLFFGVNMVAIGGLMQRDFTPEQRATMGSLTAFAGSIGFAIYSLLLGALADALGVVRALLVTQALTLVVLWLYWRTFQGEQPQREPGAVSMG
jgi:MFS family permease